MTVSLCCLYGDHDQCDQIAVINHAPYPCECACHTEQQEAT